MADPEDGEDSLPCPRLPPEIWSLIVDWFVVDQNPRELHNLARVSRAFYQEVNPRIYKSVLLKTHHDNALFTRTLMERPDLAATIRELRHDDDHGSKLRESDSVALYTQLAKLQNVETIIMRLREGACKKKPDPDKSAIRSGRQHADSPVARPNRTNEGVRRTIESSLWGVNFVTPDPHFGLPALRFCHLGSDYFSSQAQTGDAEFPESLFWHPNLEVICITNGSMHAMRLHTPWLEPPPYSTALKELKLLNTSITPTNMHRILQHPKALKKLTYRGMEPSSLDQWRMTDGDIPMDSYQEAILPQKENLETIDLDLYWSELDWEDLTPFKSLKHLIITPYVLTGPETPDSLQFEQIDFPATLETLTFRYEKGETGLPIYEVQRKIEAHELPNLKSFTIEMPEHLDMRKGANICIPGIERIITFKRAFQELGVKFEVPTVSYPKKMPSYENCSCERMEYYHRFAGHTPEYLGESDPGQDSPMSVDSDDMY